MTPDDFRLRYSGEIRETLIMIEANNGGFELLQHGSVSRGEETDRMPYAIVRSTESARTYFLVRDAETTPPWRHWHDIREADPSRRSAA